MLPSQVLVLVPPSIFDTSSSDRGKNLLVYTRWKKDMASDPLLVVSLDPGNPSSPVLISHSGNDDELNISIALRKGKKVLY